MMRQVIFQAVLLLSFVLPISSLSSQELFAPEENWEGERAQISYGHDREGNFYLSLWRKDKNKTSVKEVVDYYLDEIHWRVQDKEELDRWNAIRKSLLTPLLKVRQGILEASIWTVDGDKSLRVEELKVGTAPVVIRFEMNPEVASLN